MVEALDIYELFHIVQRQTTWVVKYPRVPFSKYAGATEEAEDAEDAEDEDEDEVEKAEARCMK